MKSLFTAIISFLIVLFLGLHILGQQSVNMASIEIQTIKCHLNGLLPDPACTPGVINPDVTQENIKQTICTTGYTKTIRPSVSYTNALKIKQMGEYGISNLSMSDTEEDHLISLEIGGNPTDPKNLWPEAYLPKPGARQKDVVESRCHRMVCAGTITLAQAQHEIATDWTNACK